MEIFLFAVFVAMLCWYLGAPLAGNVVLRLSGDRTDIDRCLWLVYLWPVSLPFLYVRSLFK